MTAAQLGTASMAGLALDKCAGSGRRSWQKSEVETTREDVRAQMSASLEEVATNCLAYPRGFAESTGQATEGTDRAGKNQKGRDAEAFSRFPSV